MNISNIHHSDCRRKITDAWRADLLHFITGFYKWLNAIFRFYPNIKFFFPPRPGSVLGHFSPIGSAPLYGTPSNFRSFFFFLSCSQKVLMLMPRHDISRSLLGDSDLRHSETQVEFNGFWVNPFRTARKELFICMPWGYFGTAVFMCNLNLITALLCSRLSAEQRVRYVLLWVHLFKCQDRLGIMSVISTFYRLFLMGFDRQIYRHRRWRFKSSTAADVSSACRCFTWLNYYQLYCYIFFFELKYSFRRLYDKKFNNTIYTGC